MVVTNLPAKTGREHSKVVKVALLSLPIEAFTLCVAHYKNYTGTEMYSRDNLISTHTTRNVQTMNEV